MHRWLDDCVAVHEGTLVLEAGVVRLPISICRPDRGAGSRQERDGAMSTPRDDGSDYQHDEAHDLVHGRVPAPASHVHQPSPGSAALPPALQDGDYAYDQAHDFGGGS